MIGRMSATSRVILPLHLPDCPSRVVVSSHRAPPEQWGHPNVYSRGLRHMRIVVHRVDLGAAAEVGAARAEQNGLVVIAVHAELTLRERVLAVAQITSNTEFDVIIARRLLLDDPVRLTVAADPVSAAVGL